jgi:hypothetical protein
MGWYQNDFEAYVLGMVYRLGLPMIFRNPSQKHSCLNPSKYEIKGKVGDETRCITLAHHVGKCNLLIKYAPSGLEN